MARGTTLAVLVSMVKAEIGDTLESGVATQRDDGLYYSLANTEQRLLSQFRWPFLEKRADVALVANDRYVNLPTTISFEYHNPVVEVRNTGTTDIWTPVGYGIGAEEFAHYDSDNNQVADPVLRWQFYGGTQFEVWPMPVTAQTIRFSGQQKITPMSSAGSTCTLDDLLLVLFVAADKLARLEAVDARLKFDQAQNHLSRLLGAYPTRRDTYNMAGEVTQPSRPTKIRISTP